MAKTNDKWFFKNLFKAVVLIALLLIITQVALVIGTRHNREISVPDFSELPLSKAQMLAEANNVRIDVSDSVFIKRLARGAVFSQNPSAGSKVKKGRRILITINAMQAKTVKMPNLVGYSLRQAKTELMTSGLKVGKLSYTDDIATNNVLEQRIKDKIIEPGTEIEMESRINLLLGRDPNNPNTYIPLLIGYPLDIAEDNIFDGSLNVGKIEFDETVTSYEDSLKAMVYSQYPSPGNSVAYPMGTSVNISLTVSQSKVHSMLQAMEELRKEETEENDAGE